MSARLKLNRANLTWAMLLGLLFGCMCESFSAFVMATLIFAASAWYAGDIRIQEDFHYPAPPSPPRSPPSDQRRGTGRTSRHRRSRR